MPNVARMDAGTARRPLARAERVGFCTHCGALTEPPEPPADRPHQGRVCPSCGLGVVLTCARATLRSSELPFLVVGRDLAVSAANEQAERIFGPHLDGRHLLSLIAPPDGSAELVGHVVRAVGGVERPVRVTVEASGTTRRIGRLVARVGACGDPPAALVVLERQRRG